MYKTIDLFSGVGGLSFGFTSAGFKVLLANEIDSQIAYSYSKNHPSVKMINSDITKLDIQTVFAPYKSSIDVVTGGPPCQGFSQKGSRRFFDDERNFLFKYFLQVVEYVRPRYFVMENVPNLLTSQKGYFRDLIVHLFNNIGYQVDTGILDASEFGVPQIRKRAIIIGRLGDKNICLSRSINKQKVTVKDAIGDLEYLNSGQGENIQEYITSPSSDYQIIMRQNANLLFNHVATKHSQFAIYKMGLIPIGKGKESLPTELLTKSIYSGTWSRMKYDEPSVTITTRFDTPSSGRFTHPVLDRAITVREAARLQSFPDNFLFYGTKSSQMKQVGNAVPPLLAKEIAQMIKVDIEN